MPYDQGQAEGKLDQLCTPFKEAEACPIPQPGDKGDFALTTGGFDIPDGQKDSYPSSMPRVTIWELDGVKPTDTFESTVESRPMTIKASK